MASFAKLTEPDGGPVYVRVEDISLVRVATPTEGAGTMIYLKSGKWLIVRESFEEVLRKTGSRFGSIGEAL